MAGRNGTGPLGMGSMTGRGLGPCGSGKSVNRPKIGFGCGYGRRYGRKVGRCRFYGNYLVDKESEKLFLEDEKAMLEARLKNINEVLDESQNTNE